ncbi:alpha/beta hydrolase family protein [Lysobacter gummosus]|uniref:alpha/beta hydrolase family protein n=1 Tax=Lysobacter gummosus TaxID=262324 RepID=UPI003637513B
MAADARADCRRLRALRRRREPAGHGFERRRGSENPQPGARLGRSATDPPATRRHAGAGAAAGHARSGALSVRGRRTGRLSESAPRAAGQASGDHLDQRRRLQHHRRLVDAAVARQRSKRDGVPPGRRGDDVSSLRGGNDNPGAREAFYGEVQDILAAADYLAKLDFVDPKRIYLGGHSTGGTLVLLVAETDPRFRGVFAFGPVADVSGYGEGMLPVALDNEAAIRLRSPVHWTASIRSPVFVFEGDHDANTEDLMLLRKLNQSPQAKYFLIPRATHFTTLAPANELIAKKIIADRGEHSDIGFSEAELSQLLP